MFPMPAMPVHFDCRNFAVRLWEKVSIGDNPLIFSMLPDHDRGVVKNAHVFSEHSVCAPGRTMPRPREHGTRYRGTKPGDGTGSSRITKQLATLGHMAPYAKPLRFALVDKGRRRAGVR